MKIMFIALMVICSFACMSCEKDEPDNNPKGLVSFAENPTYSSGNISFAASVQFGFNGKDVNCEYQILDGSVVVVEGLVKCGDNIDGMGLFWESEMKMVAINQVTYSGKTLTIYLDPSNKITSSTYTTDQYVNLYKKETVNIP